MLNFLVGARAEDDEMSSEAPADEIEPPQVQVPQAPSPALISDPFAAFDYDELKAKKTRLSAQINQLKIAVRRLEEEKEDLINKATNLSFNLKQLKG